MAGNGGIAGAIGGVSLCSRKPELTKPKPIADYQITENENSLEEIQINGEESYPLSIINLRKEGNKFVYEVEYTDIVGFPSDPWCEYNRGNLIDMELKLNLEMEEKSSMHLQAERFFQMAKKMALELEKVNK